MLTTGIALGLLVLAHALAATVAATALGAWVRATWRRAVAPVSETTLPPPRPMTPAPAPAANPARLYLLTTCAVFALLTLAHLWRIVAESRALATDPWYVAITLASAALSAWAWVVARRLRRGPADPQSGAR